MPPSRLVLLNAGGTISAVRDQDGVVRAGSACLSKRLAAPAPLPIEEIEVHRGLSEDMTLEDLSRVVRAVHAAAADPDVAGVVVAHGTDTLEESAFLADLTLKGETPVVFTGAQRTPDAPGFDGALNLADAMTVASAPEARGLGGVIVFAGRVLAARHARKRRTTAPDAFASSAGEIGQVASGALRLFARPVRPPPLPFAGLVEGIEIVTAALGVGGEVLDALIARGAPGVVLQALGRGNVGRPLAEATARAVKAGANVLVVSRSDEGGVAPEYETGRALAASGALFCGQVDAAKARLVFSALLASGLDRAQAAESLRACGFA